MESTLAKTKSGFHDVREFPALDRLAASWEVIQEEYRNLNASPIGMSRRDRDHDEVCEEMLLRAAAGEEYGWVYGGDCKDQAETHYDWLQYVLVYQDKPLPPVELSMPRTIDLFNKIEGIYIAALSNLKARSLLHLHNHPDVGANNFLQMNMGIDVPEYCYLNLCGEFKEHENGKPIIFDGSYDHFTINPSHEDRIILYLEFSKEIRVRN
jgi:aspartyl/asparaginyl beta-hydroxylase (cupin superfamily)|tara:strand:+ start:107 stop:736 length:630 start_codon:yes stop_codon:yes gene_type:complete